MAGKEPLSRHYGGCGARAAQVGLRADLGLIFDPGPTWAVWGPSWTVQRVVRNCPNLARLRQAHLS